MRRASLIAMIGAAACGSKDAPAGAGSATASAPVAAPAPGGSIDAAPRALAPDAAPACPPLPHDGTSDAVARLDLDGDQVADVIAPTACFAAASTTCVLHAMLTRDGCPTPAGTLAGALTDPHDVARLPFTSHGLAVLRTGEHDTGDRYEYLWAWSGSAWVRFYAGDAQRADGAAPASYRGGMTADAASVCLHADGAPAATFDLDGDGAVDSVFASRCEREGQRTCGNLVAVARGPCLVPVAFVAAGAVALAQPVNGDAPVVVRVDDPARPGARTDYQLDVRGGAVRAVGSRACAPKGKATACGAWQPLPAPLAK